MFSVARTHTQRTKPEAEPLKAVSDSCARSNVAAGGLKVGRLPVDRLVLASARAISVKACPIRGLQAEALP
jgi:hypothetical protein